MIRRFDLWAISKMEILAHWLQYWTGKNCFFWSKLFAVMAAAALFGEIWNDPKVNASLILNGLCIFNMLRISFFGLSTSDGLNQKYLEHMSEGRFGNPVKYSPIDFFMRCVLYAFSPLIVIGFVIRGGFNVYEVELWSMILCYMFGSCDPMPPCKGRLFAARRRALALEGRNG